MNESHEESIEIGVSPHALADSLCDELMIEIDPVSDAELLARFFAMAPDEWHPLEKIAATTGKTLPEYVTNLLEAAPKQIFLRHLPWIGLTIDTEQPSQMVVIANAASMGCNTFLMGVPESPGDTLGG